MGKNYEIECINCCKASNSIKLKCSFCVATKVCKIITLKNIKII